jgi:hypothetical protein
MEGGGKGKVALPVLKRCLLRAYSMNIKSEATARMEGGGKGKVALPVIFTCA